MAKLSEANQAYLEGLNAAADNPFEEAPEATDETQPSTDPTSGLEPINLLDARHVIFKTISKSGVELEVVPPADVTLTDIAVALPAKADFFEKTTGVAAAAASGKAFVSRAITFGDNEGQGAIDIVDLAGERVLETVVTSGPIVAADAIDGPKPRVLTYTIPKRHGRDKPPTVVTVAESDGKSLKEVKRWIPYSSMDRFGRDEISFAKFADLHHVVTVNKNGTMVLWNVDEAKPVYYTDLGRSVKPILLGGRKYMVVVANQAVSIIDILGEKAVATIPVQGLSGHSAIALSPDAKQLAVCPGSQKIEIWDIASGKRANQFDVSERVTQLDWVATDQMLLNRKFLYDLPREIFLWEYKGRPESLMRIASNVFLYTHDGRGHDGRGLFVASIPHDQAIQTTANIKPSDLSVLDAEDKVELRLDINLGGVNSNEVRKILTEMLTDLGVQVVPESDLVFEAVAYRGKSEKVKFQQFFTREVYERTVTPNHYQVRMWDKENVVWARGGQTGPGYHIRLKENETLDAALRRLTQPSADFFRNSRIPKNFKWYASGTQAFGASEWAYGGLRAAEPTKIAPPADPRRGQKRKAAPRGRNPIGDDSRTTRT